MQRFQVSYECLVLNNTVSVAAQAITADGKQRFAKASYTMPDESTMGMEATIKQVKAAAFGELVVELIQNGEI